MRRVRLDALLSERGMFPSRTRAAASVLAGEVMLGAERRRAEQPGQLVKENVLVDVVQAPLFVSRGGIKLANALDAFGLPVSARRSAAASSALRRRRRARSRLPRRAAAGSR